MVEKETQRTSIKIYIMKTPKLKDVPEDQVIVKQSICNTCFGVVRSAIDHIMTKKSRNDFSKEVFEYNLSVRSITLDHYRNGDYKFCECSIN